MNEQTTPNAAWRSLDELADTPEFRDFRDGEFPLASAHAPDEQPDRRRFLKLMAASIALGGAVGCRRPVMEILPYGRKPEEIVPGLPTFYATAVPKPGGCAPVLVECHEGRPTKIEGHPTHPHSKGKTDAFTQAAILDLYDPDRSREVLRSGQSSSWEAFDGFADKQLGDLDALGDKLRFLVGDDTSPALRLLREQFPKAVWHIWEPLSQDNVSEGTKIAFGKPMVPEYRLDQADVILCLDADPLGLDANAVSHIAGFARRRVTPEAGGNERINRLYAVEDQLSVTGAMADNRLALPGSQIAGYTLKLAEKIRGSFNSSIKIEEALQGVKMPDVKKEWIDEVVADLRIGREPTPTPGHGLIIAGPRQPAGIHALVAGLNQIIGATGNSLFWRERGGIVGRSIKELADDLAKGSVVTLVILGGNPVRDVPADLDFGEKLRQTLTIHLGLYQDETAKKCAWHLPMSHFLEAWGDVEAYDGTYSVVQPMIAPIHFDRGTQQPLTRSPLELLARWTKRYRTATAYEVVLESFKKRTDGKGDEKAFRRVLHAGFLADSGRKHVSPKLEEAAIATAVKAEVAKPLPSGKLELSFHGDYRVYDGRFANNGWLRETPDPISKLTWDNAVLISPAKADELKVTTGDLVKLKAGKGEIFLPVFVQPGQANESLSVHFGYGRSLMRLSQEDANRERNGAGFDVYPLRTSDNLWFALGVEVEKVGRKYTIASTQNHGNVTEQSRHKDVAKRVAEIARAEKVSEFLNPSGEKHHHHHSLELITHPKLTGEYQWGMVIDLSRCVGCNACAVACQAENNVPIVGKGEILRGREMFWIRLDRYYSGKQDNPEVIHQPVACVHCENASCETVCPVNAAVHSPEGLNVQVYNRCIGTRYCANNCPYKVRRFNWFDFNQRPLEKLRLGPLAPKGMAETLKMQKNPDVTVRMRGVMEKCTYCVQRIERAKINVKVAHPLEPTHPITDGTVVPACEQACPAGAIVFGNLNDQSSRVVAAKKNKRNYALLESVGMKPRTTYLLRLRNPNPKVS